MGSYEPNQLCRTIIPCHVLVSSLENKTERDLGSCKRQFWGQINRPAFLHRVFLLLLLAGAIVVEIIPVFVKGLVYVRYYKIHCLI